MIMRITYLELVGDTLLSGSLGLRTSGYKVPEVCALTLLKDSKRRVTLYLLSPLVH